MSERKTTLEVNNMHCEGCSLKISKALKENQGITKIFPDLENKKITVYFYDEKTDVPTIKEIITSLGYTIS